MPNQFESIGRYVGNLPSSVRWEHGACGNYGGQLLISHRTTFPTRYIRKTSEKNFSMPHVTVLSSPQLHQKPLGPIAKVARANGKSWWVLKIENKLTRSQEPKIKQQAEDGRRKIGSRSIKARKRQYTAVIIALITIKTRLQSFRHIVVVVFFWPLRWIATHPSRHFSRQTGLARRTVSGHGSGRTERCVQGRAGQGAKVEWYYNANDV